MRIFFLTNRRWGTDPAAPSDDFLASRHALAKGAIFGFADAAPSATPDHPDNDWNVPRSKIRNLQTILSSTDQMDSLAAVAQDQKEVLFFIHGFSNDFQNAVRRAARLAKRYYADPPLTILVTWPSPGDFLGVPFPQEPYVKDEASAWKSGPPLAMALTAALRALGRSPDSPATAGAPKIRLVAHSMGNRALRSIALNMGTITQRAIDHAFLMAADEDTDQLDPTRDFGAFLRLAGMIDVYFALDDEALLLSQKVNPPFPLPLRKRLGLFVPQERLQAVPSLSAINCSDVSNSDFGGANHHRHQYYRARPEVIDDVRQIIAKGSSSQRATDPADSTGRGFVIRPAIG